jgi:superfamily II RNA helicase
VDVSRVATRAARSHPLRRLLEGIGTPAPAPFAPDPFQIEALAALEHEDVLVTAPTGSGKTWIAREEIRRLLAAGRRAWYTSPLKALTNSKYHEFVAEFGAEAVGILTGDRKERADAPLIVGTTEVYRNQLFDALRGGHAVEADLVVLDEAHYLADEERGHVWEEAIILTPPRVRMLLLSATVGNAEEFAAWIEEVRGVRCGVVSRPGARPVPLRAAFLHPEGELAPLFDESGRFNYELAQLAQAGGARQQTSRRYGPRGGGDDRRANTSTRLNMPEMPPSTLLSALRSYDLLPAIVFLPTRRRCDEAAAEAALAPRGNADAGRREARKQTLRELAAQHPEIRKHRHWDTVARGGVAAHHAGHLPAWKLAIERLMSAGLLDAIFATATVAAGVDFPARTVVLSNIDMRRGRGWQSLTASELQQMTGRAGRRGRDNVGFIVAAPGMHQDPQKMAALLKAPPDPLESRFRATYTTLLNLLDAYGTFSQVREIAERSFARREAVERITRLESELKATLGRLRGKLAEAGCGDLPTETARGLERLASARARLLESAPHTRTEALMRWLEKEVVPGRIVSIGRGGRRLALVTEKRGSGFAGLREDGRRVSLALERVGRVYAETHKPSKVDREAIFADVHEGRNAPLSEPRLREARSATDEAVALINDSIDALTVHVADDAQRARCEEALWSVVQDAENAERIERHMEALRAESWQPFERRARVLDHFGYLDFNAERVTERGRWLADLRLERPLLVGEAIERGLFARLDAARMAGVMAALASDADRDFGELELSDALVNALAQFEQVAYEVGSVEWRQEIEPAPEINFSAAATAARWAAGVDWPTLVRETRAEEGDLFRMLSRTGESLLQITGLAAAHPATAATAERAADAILREPVRTDDV